MTTRETHNTQFPNVALDQQQITTNTTTVGNIIDIQQEPGFNSLEFFILSGVLTDGAYVLLLEHGDDPALSDAAPVPDDDLTNLESTADFADSDDQTAKRIGYVGGKRYVRPSIVSSGVSSGGFFTIMALLGHARTAPVDGNS